MSNAIRKTGTRFGRPETRAFTLIEMLVAITAGLFVSITAVALARQGSWFFQQESRIATTQFGTTIGFDRLRADIARAAFMSTPNIQKDPLRCGTIDGAWPAGLARLAAVRIDQATNTYTLPSAVSMLQAANGLTPDRLTLAGNYSSVEWFPVMGVFSNGTTTADVYITPDSGAVARSGGPTIAALSAIFQAGRVLRMLDSGGRFEYGVIQSLFMSPDNVPVVRLIANTVTMMQPGAPCGITGNGTGMLVNVVNLVRYEIRSLVGNPPLAYAQLFTDAGLAPGDETRLELVRVELAADGVTERAGSLEVVAEYAVDLKFGLAAVTTYGGTGVDPLITQYPIGDPETYKYAKDVTQPESATIGPEKIRSVRVRMAIRSREGDRRANLPSDGGAIFRYAMPDGASFARVRTMTADIALPNLAGVAW